GTSSLCSFFPVQEEKRGKVQQPFLERFLRAQRAGQPSTNSAWNGVLRGRLLLASFAPYTQDHHFRSPVAANIHRNSTERRKQRKQDSWKPEHAVFEVCHRNGECCRKFFATLK